MTKKIFLAGPFKSLMDPRSGEMDKRFRKQYEELIEFFESKGYTVHNAHKREKWGKAFMTPEECTKIDFEEIRSCDYFVAFPGSPPSPGTHIEIGWASAFGKHILLLLEHGQDYAFLIRGLHAVADVTFIWFREPVDYYRELEVLLPDQTQMRRGQTGG
ncbi:nucleoside 2-deoxyribosyltransferase [Caldalkalibacillus uzonensis]